MVKLNDALRRARLAAGMTQQEAAHSLGVRQMTLSYWETGRTAPKAETLHELATLYGEPKLTRYA